jgi:hypothetical protein
MSASVLSAAPLPFRPAVAAARQILLVGFAEEVARAIGAAWQEAAGDLEVPELRQIASLEAAAAELRRRPPFLLCFGPAAPGSELVRWLETQRLDDQAAGTGQLIVLAAGEDSAPFAPLVEDDRIFYLAARPPAPPDVAALLAAACGLAPPGELAAGPQQDDEPPAEVLRCVLEIERSRGLEEALDGVEQAARKLAPALRASCRWVDAESFTLWRPGAAGQDSRDSAVSGLVGFVARTGRSVSLARAGEDGRYDPELDGGRRAPREPFLAVALPAGPGARQKGAVEAVLCLGRGAGQPPFELEELRRLESLARESGPILRRRRLADEQARRESETEMFRRQALAHREVGLRSRQEPLRIAPAFIDRAYRAVLLCFAALVLAIPFAGSSELASGPAVVRLAERADARALSAGVLERLDPPPGAAVREGQELGRLESGRERAELELLRLELERRLVERLREPNAPPVDAAFASLRERHQVAAARLESLLVRAPRDGRVSAHLARPGQALQAGQPVLSLAAYGVAERPWVEVLLPGRFRPLLAAGMTLRFEIDGYPDAEQSLVVAEVGEVVIGAGSAGAMVGGAAEKSDTATAGGDGLVVVRADLAAAGFDSEGRRYPYFDGMKGQAEVRVRTRRFVADWMRRLWR